MPVGAFSVLGCHNDARCPKSQDHPVPVPAWGRPSRTTWTLVRTHGEDSRWGS